MSKLMSLLFETNAFKVCEENKPFWYTSGKIGPYFVNADYLYGSQNDSKELLSFIDNQLETVEKSEIPYNIFEKTLEHYENNEIYKNVIDTLKSYIEETIDVNTIDYISGGERRDWFFSNMIAYLLGKPHITIYKDLTTVVSTCDFEETTIVEKLENQRVLHIADLLNQSASFTRAWIPAIENLGSKIVWSFFIVDRKNGGTETLTSCDVKVYSLLQIDDSLFVKALELNVINKAQLDMLREFTKDPDGSMKEFLLSHPEFVQNALKSDDPKTQKRVNTLIDQNIYGLNLK